MKPQHNVLRIVMKIDAWLSFTVPVLLIMCVPLLVVVDVPSWVVTVTVVSLAAVLGGCGIIMAGVCAVAAARGRFEFPDDTALHHFHLVGPVGTRGLHVR